MGRPDPTETWGRPTEPKDRESPEWAAWREATLNKARRCLELFRKEGRYIDRPLPPAPEAPKPKKYKHGVESLHEIVRRALEIEKQGRGQG